MKESKALVYMTRRNVQIDLDREYTLYTNELIRGRLPTLQTLRYEKTQDVGSQYDYKRDNLTCTCRNLNSLRRRRDLRYFGSPKQVYAYQERSRSFTDVGIGSVKALLKKKVQRVYLPETDDIGCGSSELSSHLRRVRQYRTNSYYESKKTSSKCVGGILACNKGGVMSEKLSPIIRTVSGTTSPQESENRNIEIGSNTVNKIVAHTTTQVDHLIDKEVDNEMDCEGGSKLVIEQIQAEKNRVTTVNSPEIRNPNVDANIKYKIPEKYSSDSLVQHVHDLENPSDEVDKQSRCSVDLMENKLEREYRKIFSTKSKESKKSSNERRFPDNKSASLLKRRFEALRRGLARKDDSKKSAIITPKMSSQVSIGATSHRDVSINSDPPSLEARSYSNTKMYSPHAFPSIVEHDKSNIYNPQASYKRSVIRSQKASLSWSKTDEEDSECQGVRGMFKLWGKKFNFEEDACKSSPRLKPSIEFPKKPSERKEEIPKVTKPNTEEKEKRKFFFFKKKNKEEKKEKVFKPKKDVTAGRCEVKEGLMIKIGNADQGYKEQKTKTPEAKRKVYDEETGHTAWLQKYLSQAIESRNSVKVRWNNKTYATSSSTVFELMDNVYRDNGIIFRSKSEVTVQSSYYKHYSKRQTVNFAQQNIEAWMIPKTVTDPHTMPKRERNKAKNENMEVRISDQKWFIDKSKAFSHKIEVVLLSKNLVRCHRKESSEYLRIDIPKGFFVNSSDVSDDNNVSSNKQNLSSDEEVYKIVEYETASDLKRERNIYRSDKDKNNIKVTVSVRSHRSMEPRFLETVIKTPPARRDVVIQGSKVYIPKTCDVVGVGIITQRETKKPILTIQDGFSEDDSDHDLRLHLKKCEFAESYLQEYYRHWAPTTGMDLFSWCVSDSHLRCCSEPSKTSFHNTGDGTRSCPNILEDYQAIISSCETSHSSRRSCYVDNDPDSCVVTSRWYQKIKPLDKFVPKTDAVGKSGKDLGGRDPNALKRVLPKDSIEVFKRRKIYAASMKSQWNADCFEVPCSVPSTECKSAECRSPKVTECTPVKKPCWKPSERNPKKRRSETKHVSLPNCEEIKNLMKGQVCEPEGILAFKSATSDCKKKEMKSCKVNPLPACQISPPACQTECETMKKPFCRDSKTPCDDLAKQKVCEMPPPTSSPCGSPGNQQMPPFRRPSPPGLSLTTFPRSSPPCSKSPPTCPPTPPKYPPPILTHSRSPPSCPGMQPKCPSPPKSMTSCSSSPLPRARSPPPPSCPTPPAYNSAPPCRKPPTPPYAQPPSQQLPPCCKPPCPCAMPSSSNTPPKCPSPPEICPHSPQIALPTSQKSPPCKRKCPNSSSKCTNPSKSRRSSPKCPNSPPRCNCSHPKCKSPKVCPNSPPDEDPCCVRDPLQCPASPPPCKGKRKKKGKKTCATGSSSSSPLLPRFFKSRQSTPCKATPKSCCSPTYSAMSAVYSYSSVNQDTEPSVPYKYSKVHPCPPDYCPREDKPKETTNVEETSSCDNPPSRLPEESNMVPTPIVLHPCAQCRSSYEELANKQAKENAKGAVYQRPEVAVNRNKCSNSCTNLAGNLLSTAAAKKCDRVSCPNHPSNVLPPCQQKMICPPPPRPRSPPRSPPRPKYAPCPPSPCPPGGNRSKPKLTGVHLRISPSRKGCGSDCPGTQSPKRDDTCFNLSSEDKITIRLKKDTPSTEEIREGLNIRVEDENGLTLYERKDYVKGALDSCDVPKTSVLGDVYKNSYVQRMAAPLTGETDSNKEISEDRSNASIANTIEIQFKVKVTQGDKSTEINIANDDINKSDIIMKEEKSGKPPQEVFVLKDEGVRSDNKSDGKNDINIRIVIKNFKPKSEKNKFVKGGDYCNEFSKQISAKFHSVSTGYSESAPQNVDRVFSIHRATVDLTSSVEKSKAQSRQSEDESEPVIEKGQDKIVVSSRVTEESICVCMTGERKSMHGTGEAQVVHDKACKHRSIKHKESDMDKQETDLEKPETDTERPETDIEQPETDTEKPETDTEKPETDTEKPETDIEKPETDTEKPETDIEKPETDIEKPETDTEKLDTDAEKPDTDIERPETDTEKPETDIDRPETDTEKPETDIERPETDTEKPETDVEIPETDTEKRETDTDKPETDTEKRSERKIPFDTVISTDDDPDKVLANDKNRYDEHNTDSLEIIQKPRTKEEKKEIMKHVFEKAHDVKKNRFRMKKLRDMLKVILTSDSSEPDELKMSVSANNKLAKDVTYASLKPNYFRDSDSMNNYYTVENNTALSDRDLTNKVVYPTEDNNSECSKSSTVTSDYDTPLPAGCMCSTVAERLKMASRMCSGGGGCCCSKRRSKTNKSKETCCDIIQDSDDYEEKEIEYIDVETQNSRHVTSKVTSTNMLFENSIESSIMRQPFNIQEEPMKDPPLRRAETHKYFKQFKGSFSPHMNHVRECEMRKLNRNTILSISGEDKIVVVSAKPTRTSSEVGKEHNRKLKDDGQDIAHAADILQSYETKKAVLEIYAERDVSKTGERLVAKLPKFVYDTENEIYNAISTNSYVCKNNIIMMTINR